MSHASTQPSTVIPRYAHHADTRDYTSKLRRLLHTRRKNLGLTQAELGRRAGFPKDFVYKYETGLSRLWVTDLLRLCEVLGLDPRGVVDTLIS